MIVWITRQDVMQLADDELIEIFTNDSIDYDLKDKRVRDLEFQIVSNIILLCREKNYSKQYKDGVEPGGLYPINNSLVIEFLVKERAKLDDKTASQIVIEIDEMPFERVRTVEEVVDSIVKLLRLSVMLIVAHKGLSADNNEYEVPPPEDVIDDIDQMMKNFGLLPLPARTTKSYNKKSYIDLCVVRFVEDVFDE